MSDRIGQQLGNYVLQSLLGQGGFADVYLGEHIYLKTKAAIKVLRMRLTDKELQDFIQEARIIAALQHPHIVRVLDFGVDGNIPFLVMDYAPNGTLRQRHVKGTKLPIETILHYIKQAAAGLQYAHDHKVVHRDIKPENLLLNGNNDVLVSDFGLAVVVDSSYSWKDQKAAGTAIYMSPEQFNGKVCYASDQYALAIVVFEWLTGHPPFYKGSPIQLAYQHCYIPIPSLRTKKLAISPMFERVIMKALAKKPQDRFVSVQAFVKALEEAAPSLKSIMMNVVPEKASLPIGTLLNLYRDHSKPVHSVAWTLDGRYIASGSSDESVQVWNPTTKRRRRIYKTGTVTAIDWSPDGKYLASGGMDRKVHVWDVDGGREPGLYSGHADWVRAVAWCPDGNRIVSGDQGSDRRRRTLHLWDAATQKRILTCRGYAEEIRSVKWSPDGQYIASGSADTTVRIWNATTGDQLLLYERHSSYIDAVTWAPDGKFIASGSWDRTVQVWDAERGRVIFIHRGHTDYVHAVAWSPDGKRIASAGEDTTVQVWDPTTGKHLFTYKGHKGPVKALAWSPDSMCIASCGDDTTVQIWQAV